MRPLGKRNEWFSNGKRQGLDGREGLEEPTMSNYVLKGSRVITNTILAYNYVRYEHV